jgi:xanthosine utilization system XapX-like protein
VRPGRHTPAMLSGRLPATIAVVDGVLGILLAAVGAPIWVFVVVLVAGAVVATQVVNRQLHPELDPDLPPPRRR